MLPTDEKVTDAPLCPSLSVPQQRRLFPITLTFRRTCFLAPIPGIRLPLPMVVQLQVGRTGAVVKFSQCASEASPWALAFVAFKVRGYLLELGDQGIGVAMEMRLLRLGPLHDTDLCLFCPS